MLAWWLGAPPASSAAPPSPRVSAAVNISADSLTDNEVSIAVNPANPLNLVAGWNAWEEDRQGVGYAYSFDGGRTWSPAGLLPLGTDEEAEDDSGRYKVAGDPAFVFGPDGTAYAVFQSFEVMPPFEARLLVAVSSLSLIHI